MHLDHFLKITDLTPDSARALLQRALDIKAGKETPQLPGKTLALLFEKPSLRTRTSFDVAMYQMGGHCLYLSPDEVDIGKRESIRDVALVLSRFVQAIAARTFTQDTVEQLAKWGTVPVINALSDTEHPCQALADILTLWEYKKTLSGLTIAYIGDANNCSNSLMYLAAMTGVHFRIASPDGYQVSPKRLAEARAIAEATQATVSAMTDPAEAVRNVDAVYTDVWTSMGQEDETDVRKQVFRPYQINEALLSAAKPDVMLLHPLPAHHGDEVAEGVLYRQHSAVFDQAENRLHAQKAILAALLAETAP